MEENKLWHFHNGGRVYIDGRGLFYGNHDKWTQGNEKNNGSTIIQ